MAVRQVPTESRIRLDARRVAEVNVPRLAGEDYSDWLRRVEPEVERITKAEVGWLNRVVERGGPDLVLALTEVAPVRPHVDRVKLAGTKAAEGARHHLALFGHWPVDGKGSTVSSSGRVVQADKCVACHPHLAKGPVSLPKPAEVKVVPGMRGEADEVVFVSVDSTPVQQVNAPKPKPKPVSEPVTSPVAPEPVGKGNPAPAPSEAVSVPSVASGGLPERVADYLDRLIHEPKREYARALVAHRLAGGPVPERPAAAWVVKVESKLDRLGVSA